MAKRRFVIMNLKEETMSRKLYFLLVVFLFALFVGCEETTNTEDPKGDPAGAQVKVQLANQSLESTFLTWSTSSFNNTGDFDRLNFTTSNTLYKEALVLDPTNTHASFGAALTEILSAYADPDIKAMIKKMEASADSGFFGKAIFNIGLFHSTSQMKLPVEQLALNSFFIFQKALTDPPLISEVQAVLKNKFLPRVSYAIDRLNHVTSTDTFRFEVTGRMQGDQNRASVYLYPAEAHFFAAAINGVNSMLEGMMVYKFEMTDYSQASIVAALNQDNPNFFGLASDGTTRSANAKGSMNEMINKLLSGIQKLESISGSKTDAVIKLGNDGIRQSDLDTVKTYLNKMKTSMTQPISIFIKDGDRDGNDYTVQVFLGKFFDNPVANPKKSFLPSYTVEPDGEKGIQFRFNADTYDQFIFPDPTFGGVFPGMTNDNLKKLMRIDEEFAYKLQGSIDAQNYQLITIAPKLRIVTPSKNYDITANSYFNGWGYYYEYEFFIMDQNNQAFTIFIDYGEGFKELNSSDPLVIKAKDHIWKQVTLSHPGQLYASSSSNPVRVSLSWSYWLEKCVIQRSIGSNELADYQNLDYSYNFEDNNVSAGVTYNYRVRTSNIPNNWQLVLKDPAYSNSVTITP
jgi:hypothetical protein